MLYEGSVIATGTVLAAVVAVRNQTEVGRSLADAPEPPASGVEARLSALTKLTVPATVASGAAVTGMSLLRGRSPRAAVSSGVSLMVAAVPEGLPLLATVAQLAAAHRLAERGALVRNPRTIEALGRVDVLCFDKTGTLTAGHIALQRVSDGSTEEPVGDLSPRSMAVLAAALRASPADDGDDLPHATDRAVLEGADAAGVEASHGLGGWSLLGELAFEPARGYHAVVGDSPSGSRVSVKGAPEIVLPRCTTWRAPEGITVIDRRIRLRLDAEVERLASQGLRVLAVAERPAAARSELADERVSDMELFGFLGLADGVRPTAAAAVADLRSAGVSVVMITGDHPSTAAAIAEELHILNGAPVLTGADLDAWDDDKLDAVLGEATVFARVTPAHKMRIIRAYQRIGRTVAMTGDGANDAPAIRLAHTGIALGGRGSPAAREAADLVVLDDRIETVIDAIVEGRAMWASVRDALAILIGGNLGEVAFVLASTAIAGASPLGARQMLLVNLLTDMLPAMTIALRSPARRSPEELLHEGPEASLGGALATQIALRAATTAAGATGAWLLARPTGTSRRASTVALAALVGTQLGQTAFIGGTSPIVLTSTLVSAGVLVGIVQTPGLSHFFGCTPMGPVGWGIAVGSAVAATGSSVVVPWAVRRLPQVPSLLSGAKSPAVLSSTLV
jgi:cation-transporting ATPase I